MYSRQAWRSKSRRAPRAHWHHLTYCLPLFKSSRSIHSLTGTLNNKIFRSFKDKTLLRLTFLDTLAPLPLLRNPPVSPLPTRLLLTTPRSLLSAKAAEPPPPRLSTLSTRDFTDTDRQSAVDACSYKSLLQSNRKSKLAPWVKSKTCPPPHATKPGSRDALITQPSLLSGFGGDVSALSRYVHQDL